MAHKFLHILGCAAALLLLPSCLESDVQNYDEWRAQNDAYLTSVNTSLFERYVPDWAPEHYIFMRWHNDRTLTERNLVPISTSTVKVKYEMEDINGTKLGNSYKANGDSIYQSRINANIVGFQAALTNMHVGDSVTVILPYNTAYGKTQNGNVKPYSDLIYHLKLVEIVAYEKSAN